MIGRKLYPLLCGAGYHDVRVSPRMVYVDSSRPGLVEGFTQKTFTAMVAGVGPEAVSSGMVTAGEWEKGILGLNRTDGRGRHFLLHVLSCVLCTAVTSRA